MCDERDARHQVGRIRKLGHHRTAAGVSVRFAAWRRIHRSGNGRRGPAEQPSKKDIENAFPGRFTRLRAYNDPQDRPCDHASHRVRRVAVELLHRSHARKATPSLVVVSQLGFALPGDEDRAASVRSPESARAQWLRGSRAQAMRGERHRRDGRDGARVLVEDRSRDNAAGALPAYSSPRQLNEQAACLASVHDDRPAARFAHDRRVDVRQRREQVR
jgi:hypothetical protein